MDISVLVVLIFVVAIVILACVPMVIAMLRVARRWSMERSSPLLRSDAVVVDKRTKVIGSDRGPTDQTYYATFQFPDGSRLELEVPGRESGVLVVGDQGALEWQGPRYLGFAREIMR